jgi:hypothetical protein
MSEDWTRVNFIIGVLGTVLIISLAALAIMMSTDKDFDTLMEGPEICWLPLSVAAIVLSLGLMSTYVPYRGTGRKQFDVGLEEMLSRVEMYLVSQGIKFEKDVRVDQVRKTRDHWDTYTFSLDGRGASILVRGREGRDSTMLLVSPWPLDPTFVDGLERAILM